MKNVFASASKTIKLLSKLALIFGSTLQAGFSADASQVADLQETEKAIEVYYPTETIEEMESALLLSPFNASNFPIELQIPILGHAGVMTRIVCGTFSFETISFGNITLVCKYWRDLRNSFLPACINYKIPSEDHLDLFKNVVILGINRNTQISENCLGNLTKLKTLNIIGNSIIDDSVSKLTGLENMIFSNYFDEEIDDYVVNSNITDISLGNLTNLRVLCFEDSGEKRKKIRDGSLSKLTKLTSLAIPGNQGFRDKFLAQLVNLTYLDMHDNSKITDVAIKSLTNLRGLDCHRYVVDYDFSLTIDSLKALPFLTELTVGAIGRLRLDTQDISDDNLMLLTNLRKLNLYGYYNNERDAISKALPNLEVIDLDEGDSESESQ